jgi:hypothetical protein
MIIFRCDECGSIVHHSQVNSCGTGYALVEGGDQICYSCCGRRDMKALRESSQGDRFCFYLTFPDHKATVTNWPGTLRIKCDSVAIGSHNWRLKRYDVWFTFEGLKFWGVVYGDNTQLCHIKRLKG